MPVYVITTEQYYANNFNVAAAFTDEDEARAFLAEDPRDRQLYRCMGSQVEWITSG